MFRKFTGRLALALLFVGTCALAAPVGKDKAVNAYKGWIRSSSTHMGLELSQKNIAESYTQDDAEGRALYHVLNLVDGGYVVISAEDRIEPVLAFSDEGEFTSDPESPLYKMLFADLASRFESCDQADLGSSVEMGEESADAPLAEESSFAAKTARWNSLVAEGVDEYGTEAASSMSSIDDVRVNTLVSARWTQGSAENQFTPNNYVCGCVATAMAQLMRYHEHPVAGIGLRTRTVTVDGDPLEATTRGGDGAGGPYDWTQMPNYPNSSHTQVGALCYDAGVSVYMSYSSSGSGAYMSHCPSAFMDWFGYASAKSHTDYSSASEEMIQNTVNANLDAAYPVLFAISSDSGAHAVLCDGYGFNGGISYHHVNMGWGGSNDAWYNLPEINDYTKLYRIIYNVFPHEGGAIISGRVMGADGYPVVGVQVTATDGALVLSATTNSKGIYYFAHVDSGTYVVTVSDEDFTSDTITVSVGDTTSTSSCPNSWGIDLSVSDAILTADEDAYVRAFSPNTNYGSSTNLNAQDASGSEVFESFIKFDMSDVDDVIENAQLRISVSANASDAQNQLFLMTDDSWRESRVTYNNRPTEGRLIADITPTFVPTTTVTTTLIDGTLGNGNLDNDSTVNNLTSGDTWSTRVADSKYYIAANPTGSGYYTGWTVSRVGTYPGGNDTIGMLTYAHALAYDSGTSPDFCAFANSGGVQVQSDPISGTFSAGCEVVVTFKGSTATDTNGFSPSAAFIFDEGELSETTYTVTPTAVSGLTQVTYNGDQTGYVATYTASCVPTTDYSTVSVRAGVANATASVGVALDDVEAEYSTTGVGAADKLLCIDVSDAVVQELADDGVVTFCVRGDAGLVSYGSRESDTVPQLLLSQSAEANSATDWEGDSTQPDGQWSYGCYAPDAEYTTFSAYPVHTTYYGGSKSWIGGNGVIWDHAEGYPRVGKYAMSPYGGTAHSADTTSKYESVKRWTSNIKGVVTVLSDLQQIQSSADGNIVTIRKNGTQIWSQDLESSYRAVNSLELAVYPGDVIDFAVDPVGTHSADWIYWRARISTQTPMANQSGLVAHYDFDEASDMPTDADGNQYDRKMFAFDYSGNDHHGTLENCDTWTVWKQGKIGHAIDLDGANDYVETSASLNPAQNNFTVAAWVKGGGANDVIVSQSRGQDWIKLDASGRLASAVKSSSGSVLTDGSAWDASEWHHVALSWDGSKRYLYVDGKIVASDGADMSSPVSATGSMIVGASAGIANHFDGMVDDLGVWSRSLSTMEIFSIWMSGGNDRNLSFAKSYVVHNTKPVAEDVTVEVVSGSSVSIVLDGHDDDGDELVYTIMSSPATGAIRGSGARLTYYSAPNFSGEDSFSYVVSDGMDESESATVTVTVLSNSDSDGDLLPNDWETQYFGSSTAADPLADSDGDQLKNLAEYAFGGNPTNAADTGIGQIIQNTAGSLELCFSLRDDPELVVSILSCTNLISGLWETNAVQVGADGSDFSSYTNSLPDEDCLFIKLRVD